MITCFKYFVKKNKNFQKSLDNRGERVYNVYTNCPSGQYIVI